MPQDKLDEELRAAGGEPVWREPAQRRFYITRSWRLIEKYGQPEGCAGGVTVSEEFKRAHMVVEELEVAGAAPMEQDDEMMQISLLMLWTPSESSMRDELSLISRQTAAARGNPQLTNSDL
eukprot:3446354-Amphidinium_carterae.1